MGEEAKQKEVKAETKQEEKPEEKKDEKAEEPKPPSPVVLFVDLHCVGCAKKIEKSILRFRGVEEVMIDMAQNQVTIKGIVDPQALCIRIQKKTKRRASILSPLPAPEGEPTPPVVTSQVSGLTSVELNVKMHCEACAQQLKKKILKMRGVQTAETDLGTGKVKVMGTMDASRLVDYVYRRTKKQAQIVPQPEPEPEPEPKPEEKKEEGEKPVEEAAKPEEKKEENVEKKEEEKPPEVEKKDDNNGENKENSNKEEMQEAKKEEELKEEIIKEELVKRMMYYYPSTYVIERIPPPQLFSDENPNACCIS